VIVDQSLSYLERIDLGIQTKIFKFQPQDPAKLPQIKSDLGLTAARLRACTSVALGRDGGGLDGKIPLKCSQGTIATSIIAGYEAELIRGSTRPRTGVFRVGNQKWGFVPAARRMVKRKVSLR
jgi:hypothetical protein